MKVGGPGWTRVKIKEEMTLPVTVFEAEVSVVRLRIRVCNGAMKAATVPGSYVHETLWVEKMRPGVGMQWCSCNVNPLHPNPRAVAKRLSSTECYILL